MSLIAHWPFDEGSGGTAADATGNGRTVALQAAAWEIVAPKVGAAAIKWDGTDSYLGAFTALALGTTHSVAAWLLNWPLSADGIVLGGLPGNYAIYLDTTSLYYNAAGAFVAVAHGILTAGVYHVAVVRNGTTSVSFYVNGVVKGTGVIGANNALTVSHVGGNSTGGFSFHGGIDDLRIYNHALSAAEIGALPGFALPVQPGTGVPDTVVGSKGTLVLAAGGAPSLGGSW